MNNKLNILIDTNSLFHLSEADIKIAAIKKNESEVSLLKRKGKGEKAAKWLWKYCNVYICNTIIDEIKRNLKKITNASDSTIARETLRKLKKNGIKTNTKYTTQIEEKILRQYISSASLLNQEDRGERHLLCDAIELVFYKKNSQNIIVTDDYSAQIKFMYKVQTDYPFGQIWNVFDLILYFYFTQREVTFNQVEIAIRDLVALSSISIKKYKKQGYTTESDARLAMLKEYLSKAEKIKTIRSLLPKK